MARLIDAKFAQHIANVELNYDDAGTVQWVLSHTPTVDAVEVVHGRWEDMSDKFDKGMDLRCSVCHRRASNFVGGSEDWWDMWKPFFCPNCGAKMDGDGNATD